LSLSNVSFGEVAGLTLSSCHVLALPLLITTPSQSFTFSSLSLSLSFSPAFFALLVNFPDNFLDNDFPIDIFSFPPSPSGAALIVVLTPHVARSSGENPYPYA
jgi:hypothetical protein